MRHRLLSLILAAGLVAALALAACGGATSPPTLSNGAPSAPPPADSPTALAGSPTSGRSLTIVSLEGAVEFRVASASAFAPATASQSLGPGDEIRTGPNGKAALQLDDGTQIVVSSNTSFVVKELGGQPENPITRFFLNLGQVFALHDGELSANSSFEIETPSGVAAIRGSYIGVIFFPGSNSGVVMCLAGHCLYFPPGSDTARELLGDQGLKFSEEGDEGEDFELTEIHLDLWANALEFLSETLGDDQTQVIACDCQGAALVCDDGQEYPDFEACLPPEEQSDAPLCWCDEANLVCDDGSYYPEDSSCLASGGENYCYCDGTTTYCLDGSVYPDDPSCSAEYSCYCDGTTLVCPDASYEDDSYCAGQSDFCAGVVCGDGYCDSYCGEDESACPADCDLTGGGGGSCGCEGDDYVCRDDYGVETSRDASACVGGGNCYCEVDDYVCYDASGAETSRDVGACASGGNCYCEVDDYVCYDASGVETSRDVGACASGGSCGCEGDDYVCYDTSGVETSRDVGACASGGSCGCEGDDYVCRDSSGAETSRDVGSCAPVSCDPCSCYEVCDDETCSTTHTECTNACGQSC